MNDKQRAEKSINTTIAARDQVIAECWKLVYHWRGRSLPLMLCADELAAILPKEED